jgi:hypothetical protein
MNRIVRKLRPGDYWRIGEHESWFTDLAAQGLHLKKMGLHFAQFVPGESKQTRYRIEVSSSKSEITAEQKEMYAEGGWNYVTSYGQFHVFSSPVELNAPELHTDPAEQSYTLEDLDKKFVRAALIAVLSAVFIVGMIAFVWFFDSIPTLALVEGRLVSQSFLIPLQLYMVYSSLKAARSIRSLRKTLAEGKPINHHAPWRKHFRVNLAVSTVYILFVFLVLGLPFVQIARSRTETLPEAYTNLPIVRLAEVEQNPALERRHSYWQKNIDLGNSYRYDWSLLAPIKYQSGELGIVPNAMWQDGSGIYSPSIDCWVYKLRLPSMADGLIADLIKRFGVSHRGGEYIQRKHPSFDLLTVHETEDFKEVFASKGKGVIYVRYYGYADLETVVENAAQKIVLVAD